MKFKSVLKNKALLKIAIVLFFILTLMGCARDQNYRGVSSRDWQHLTPEQRQLIVDECFHKDMQKLESDSE
jgi:hypothetical protein